MCRSGISYVAGISLLASAGSLPAQEIRGRVLDSVTRQPVLLATMTLLDSTFAVADRTYSDQTGAFVLRTARPGGYFVLADRVGYRRTLDGIVELDAGGLITVDFFLRPQPVALDTIPVAARREQTHRFLESVGFYERLNERSAWFLTPEDLEKRVETDVARLFQAAPRAKVVEQSPITTLLFRGGSLTSGSASRFYGHRPEDPDGYCTPRVLVNGIQVAPVTKGIPGATLDDVVDAKDIAAVEVHAGPASLPLIYGGTSTTCATILVWTRLGASKGSK